MISRLFLLLICINSHNFILSVDDNVEISETTESKSFVDEDKINNDANHEMKQDIKDIDQKTISDGSNDNEEKSSNEDCQLELLDQIVSEVTFLGAENIETNIITKQEVERRGFDGNVYNEQDLENQVLADQFSKVLKVNITNDDINRNLKKNGMTDKDINELTQRWNYLNKEEFFEDLKKMYRGNAALNFEVESYLVSSQEDIKQCYDLNIDQYKEEAKYIVETAFIPYPNEKQEINASADEEGIKNQISKKIQKTRDELDKYIKSEINKPEYVNWDFPVEINQSEITVENEFLIDLSIGSMMMKEAPGGFVLYRMKNCFPERLVPLENVKESIILKLKKAKYPEVVKKIQEKFRSQAIITHPTDNVDVPCSLEDLKD